MGWDKSYPLDPVEAVNSEVLYCNVLHCTVLYCVLYCVPYCTLYCRLAAAGCTGRT